jgi:hypothetical protein
MFVVFDLDGTLANCDHRIHHIRLPDCPDSEWPRQDWTAFYAACKDDSPIAPVIHVARAMMVTGHRVEIWTGRSDECRAETALWLQRNGLAALSVRPHLRMRPAGDHTADHKLKRSWIDPDQKPDIIFEDRASVVAMWRAEGIICAQVAPGDF